ncbi:hypothetical protein GCM10010217_66320 [Streptomyces tubercidicus]
MKPFPNALSAFPSWIRRNAAPIAVVTLTYLGQVVIRIRRRTKEPRQTPGRDRSKAGQSHPEDFNSKVRS